MNRRAIKVIEMSDPLGEPVASAAAPLPHQAGRLRRALRRLGLTLLLVYFLVAIAFLVVRYLIWPDLERWRPRVEEIISDFTGQSVSITGLRGDFEGFSPAISATRIQMGGRTGEPALVAETVQATLSWRTLLGGSPNFQLLSVGKGQVRVDRLSDRELAIGTVKFILPEARSDLIYSRRGGQRQWKFPDWLLHQQAFSLGNIDVDYRDLETDATLTLRNLSARSFGMDERRELFVNIPEISGQDGSVQIRAVLERESFTARNLVGKLAPSRWHGDANVQVTDFEVGAVAALLRDPPIVRSGKLNAQAWFALKDSAPSGGRLDINATGIGLAGEQEVAVLRELGTQIGAVWEGNGNLRLTFGHTFATDANGNSVAIKDREHWLVLDPEFHPLQAHFSLQAFDAGRFRRFAMQLPFPTEMKERFRNVGLVGKIDLLDVQFDAITLPMRYRVNASFSNLSASYHQNNRNQIADARSAEPPAPQYWSPRIPSAENLSGSVQITEQGGVAQISGQDAALSFPGIFSEPRIPLQKVSADLEWQFVTADGSNAQRSDSVLVNLNRVVLDNEDAHAELSGSWRSGPGKHGTADLRGSLQRARADRVHRYLPMEINADVRDWMRNAFVSGRSDNTRWILKGNLDRFPFRRAGTGRFLIEAPVRDGQFRYSPGWPEIHDLHALVKIEGASLKVTGHSGRVFDAALSNFVGTIDDFRDSVLQLDGQATGRAQDMLRYVNTSPIAARIDHFTKDSRASGDARLMMSLRLPLKNSDDFTIKVNTAFNDSNVRLTDYLPELTRASGELQITEQGISFDKVTASALGGPVTISASSPQRNQLNLTIAGKSTAAGLRNMFDGPVTDALQGETSYTADVTVKRGATSLDLRSNLQGMRVSLPSPFNKSATESSPLRIRLQPLQVVRGAVRNELVTVNVGDDSSIVFQRQRDKNGQMRVTRGVLAIGAIADLPDSGLRIAVEGHAVNLDPWIAFVQGNSAPQSDATLQRQDDRSFFAGFDMVPKEVTLVVPSAVVSGKRFNDIVLGASRNAGRWKASVRTREANGYVTFNSGTGSAQGGELSARFVRLEIPATEMIGFENMLSQAPAGLPAMDIRAEQFVLKGIPLGRLHFAAVNERAQWQINRISLESADSRLAGSGTWRPAEQAGTGQTRLDFDLDIGNSGVLLTRLGMPDTIDRGPGKISGQIHWQGSPLSLDLPSLGGKLNLALGRGQFLKTEPGIAKLIGVLSLQALPRRLSLDFSDVFQDGFAFDTIVGLANIEAGVATTESLMMRGVQAEVLIRGSANTTDETQNLKVTVLPHVNAGLASLYAAVANPALGLGTLVAQMLLDRPLQKIFSREFLITGPWASPEVTAVERREIPSPQQMPYSPG